MYKFIFMCTLFLVVPNVANGVVYYRGLPRSDALELDIIRENYHRFSSDLRIIALRRIEDIKLKLMDKKYMIQNYLDTSGTPVVMYDKKYGFDTFNAIKYVQQKYIELPESLRLELVEFAMNFRNFSSLSPTAKKWYSSKTIVTSRNN